jgi:hypothetical protein
MARRQSALGLCVLALTGCAGGDESDPTPRESPAVAKAAKTLRGETVQVRVTRTGTIENKGDFSFEGTGTVLGNGSRGVMKGELVDTEDRELSIEVRFDGNDTWIGAEQLRGRLPDEASWIHSGEVLTVERTLTPWFLADLLDATYDVDEVGEQEIDGALALHYRGVVEIKPLLKAIPEVVTSNRGDDRLPVDIWLADGRVKRMRLDYKAYPASFFMDAVVTGHEDQPIPDRPAKGDSVEVEDVP